MVAHRENLLEQVDALLVTNHEAEFVHTSSRPASAEVAPLEHTCEQMRDEDAVVRSSTESLNEVRPVCLVRPQAMQGELVSAPRQRGRPPLTPEERARRQECPKRFKLQPQDRWRV